LAWKSNKCKKEIKYVKKKWEDVDGWGVLIQGFLSIIEIHI